MRAGWDFTPDLISLRNKPQLLEAFQHPTEASRRLLPAAFQNDPNVSKMLRAVPEAQRYEDLPVALTFSPWLDFMQPRLHSERFWLDSETLQMGKFGAFFVGMFRPIQVLEKKWREEEHLLAEEAEIGWISALVTLDQPVGVDDLALSMEKLELPGRTWERLVEIGLSRTDLADGTPLNASTARHAFSREMDRIDSQNDEARNSNFAALTQRVRVNRLWHALQEDPSSSVRPAPDKATYERLRSTDAFSPGADPYALVVELNSTRQDAVAALVIMELKRLRADGMALPNDVSALRPEIGRLVKAYSTWIEMHGDSDVVQVVLGSRTFHIPRTAPTGKAPTAPVF